MAATVGIVVGLGTAALAQSLLRKLLTRWSNRKNFGGLESLVSFSSRLIAAARAVESMRPDAFVVDPLACILAGPKAMAKYKDNEIVVNARNSSSSSSSSTGQQALHATHDKQQQEQRAAESEQQQQQQPTGNQEEPQQCEPTQQAEQRQVPRLIMRTCFFDDAALAAVGAPPQRAVRCLQPLLQHVAEHGLPSCKQVVLLGSGMDTRPWRLALPPGIAWFEVDRHDVLAAKRAELSRSGVKFTAAAAPSSSSSSSSSTGGSAGTELRAGSWSCAAVDLQVPGWTAELLAAGLDPQAPTAWLAEGLLYYLDPSCVGGMLQEAASISAPGSFFAGNFLTAEGLGLLHSRSASTAAAPPAAASANIAAPAAASANTAAPAAASANTAAPAAAVPGTAGEATAEPSPAGSSNSSSSSSSRPRPSGLMSQFKWGCPDNVEEFFAEQGWSMLVRHSWRQAAGTYGWVPQVAAGSEGKPPSQDVQFSVSVVK
uniref:S-adenosyl-L-methionine-dependent methyltransferase n=1 Tax=Tetradesmus obliquus TaxID=3088 RepID=A0A383VJH4_TETOB|eukprot:jgi/Sobl393_1/18624/SZX65361.1